MAAQYFENNIYTNLKIAMIICVELWRLFEMTIVCLELFYGAFIHRLSLLFYCKKCNAIAYNLNVVAAPNVVYGLDALVGFGFAQLVFHAPRLKPPFGCWLVELDKQRDEHCPNLKSVARCGWWWDFDTHYHGLVVVHFLVAKTMDSSHAKEQMRDNLDNQNYWNIFRWR